MERPDSFVAELERVTAELLASDPLELAQAGALLERRSQAIAQVHRAVSAPGGAPPEWVNPDIAARLEAALAQGGAIEENLQIARASVRQQLAELYRTGFQARAMSAMSSEERTWGLDA